MCCMMIQHWNVKLLAYKVLDLKNGIWGMYNGLLFKFAQNKNMSGKDIYSIKKLIFRTVNVLIISSENG
jgi:uncharacterized protein YvpB